MTVDEVEALATVRYLDDSAVRDQLWREHGAPVRVRDDVDGQVLVFAHADEGAARVFAAADRVIYGHPTSVELREAVGWVSVVDLRPRLAELERRRVS